MPVRVITMYSINGGDQAIQEHDDGEATLISDGHLIVSRNAHTHSGSPSNVVAMYAPGTWKRAEVVKKQAADA